MNSVNRLKSYIEALRPILYIQTFDFYSFDNIISEISNNVDVYEYNEGLGYVNFRTKKQKSDYSLEQFLKLFQNQQKKQVYLLLKDIHKQLEDTKVISLLKSIALRTMYEDNYNITVFIVSTKLVIPMELEKLITIYDTPLPNENKIVEILSDFETSMNIQIEDDLKRELALYFKGFGEFEIIQILNLAYQRSGAIKNSDIDFILEEKKQIIKKSGMVEILDFKENIDDIGGLDNLKDWLRNKSNIYNQLEKAIEFGVDIPKGIMIVGMPGCGKSLTAKATARLFNVPLLRLDVGKLLGKYVGESEDNMRRAISITEAVAPCILWIDEIEKA